MLSRLAYTATRVIFGTSAFSSSRRLGASSVVALVRPVTLPPGRARLAASPLSTGSATAAITIGISLVAALAARVAGVPRVTIKSTLLRTSSAASSAKRSVRPSAER